MASLGGQDGEQAGCGMRDAGEVRAAASEDAQTAAAPAVRAVEAVGESPGKV